MLKEFVGAIVDLAKRSNEPKTLALPENKLLLVKPDGTSEVLYGDEKTFGDNIATFPSVLEWIGERDQTDLVITASDTTIRAVESRDIPYRGNSCTLIYRRSAAMLDLLEWVEMPRSQRAVVKAMRTTLAGTFDEKHLAVFRLLDFSRNATAKKAVEHAKESLGRSVESVAQSTAGDIPDTIVFRMPLFTNVPCEPVQLRMAIDVNHEQESIGVAFVGDCLEEAIQTTRASLASRLKSESPNALVFESA